MLSDPAFYVGSRDKLGTSCLPSQVTEMYGCSEDIYPTAACSLTRTRGRIPWTAATFPWYDAGMEVRICVEMRKPYSWTTAQQVQSQGKNRVSRDGQARLSRVVGRRGLRTGKDVVEPRKMDLDTTMKYSG